MKIFLLKVNLIKKSKKFIINLSSKENVFIPILNYNNNKSQFNLTLDLASSEKFYELKKFLFEEGKNKLKSKILN